MDKKFRYILLKNKPRQKWNNFFENIEHYQFMCIVGMTVASSQLLLYVLSTDQAKWCFQDKVLSLDLCSLPQNLYQSFISLSGNKQSWRKIKIFVSTLLVYQVSTVDNLWIEI